jgi:hypothetical protein
VRSIGVDFSGILLGKKNPWCVLAGKFAQEFTFVHVVFEGFAAVYEYYRDLIGELAAKLFVRVDVYFCPGEAALALQFDEAFFDYFAEMASFSGVD